MIPADVRIVRAKDLQVNQSMLTGEALPAEKSPAARSDVTEANLLDAPNLGFMGTSVVSGSGTGVVVGTGRYTAFGSLSSALVGARPETAFDLGIKPVSYKHLRAHETQWRNTKAEII